MNIRMLFMLALLAGCSSTKQPPRQETPALEPVAVMPITEAAAARCAYVDDLVGSSSLYGAFAERGISRARQSLLAQAQEKGANAIVWGQPSLGYGSTSVTARAYRCP